MPPHLNWSDNRGRWHRPVAVTPLPARAPARQTPLCREGLTTSLVHVTFGSGTNWSGDGGQLVSTDGPMDSAVDAVPDGTPVRTRAPPPRCRPASRRHPAPAPAVHRAPSPPTPPPPPRRGPRKDPG